MDQCEIYTLNKISAYNFESEESIVMKLDFLCEAC